MNRNTKVAVFVISTVLSIVFLYLSYYGLTRYLSVYVRSIDHYIEQYQNPGVDTPEVDRIVLCIYLRPENINNILPVIKGLLDQTRHVSQIALHIPTGTTLPVELRTELEKAVNIFNIKSAENGDVLVLKSVLNREGECGTIIIVLKDNIIYGRDFIETMVATSCEHPECAIQSRNPGLTTRNQAILVKPEFFGDNIFADTKPDIEGYCTANKIDIDYTENYRVL